MKILFDQGTPAPLRYSLEGHSVFTAFEMGWSTLRNGELIRAAIDTGFHCMITTDQLRQAESWEAALAAYPEDEYEMLLMELGERSARLYPQHNFSHLYNRQNEPDFAKLFDDTLFDIGAKNIQTFAVKTFGGAKITLFDRVSHLRPSDPSQCPESDGRRWLFFQSSYPEPFRADV